VLEALSLFSEFYLELFDHATRACVGLTSLPKNERPTAMIGRAPANSS
jgi:hypothetical protein